MVLRADMPGYDDARAHGKAQKKTDGHEGDGARTGDSRQSASAHQIAYDESVRRVVKLLEKITDEDRQRIAQYDTGDGPVRHKLDV